MKKKTTVLVGLLMAVVLTAYSVSGTYAKYTTTGGTTESARVARWNIKVNDTNTETVKLFNKTYGDNEEVKSSTDANVVAPGTSGVYTASISGSAEVAYEVKTKIEITNNVLYSTDVSPIKLSLDGTTWYEYNDSAFEALLEDSISKVAAGSTEGSVSIHWKWAYDKAELVGMGITPVADFDYDAEDTKLGQAFMTATASVYDAAYEAKLRDSLADTTSTLAELEAAASNAQKQAAIQAAEEARKNATGITEPDITIKVSITATQVDSQTGAAH